jgi:hypothetical protein
MKRALALVAFTSLTACSVLGLGDQQDQAGIVTDPPLAAEVAAEPGRCLRRAAREWRQVSSRSRTAAPRVIA